MSNQSQILTLYRLDFYSFLKFAFDELYPEEVFRDKWYLEVMADNLAQCANGDVKKLIINLPPQTLKSFCTSIALVAWYLGHYPDKNILCIHSNRHFGQEMNGKLIKLMMSDRYRAIFPSIKITPTSKGIKTNYSGSKIYVPTLSDITGHGADLIILDDPERPDKSSDKVYRKKINDWYDKNIAQYISGQSNTKCIIATRRVHEKDIVSHVKHGIRDWKDVCIPAVAATNEEWILSNGRVFSRKKYDVICSETLSKEKLIIILNDIDAYNFVHQYQQSTVRCSENNVRSIFNTIMVISTEKYRDYGIYVVPEKEMVMIDVFGTIEPNPYYPPLEEDKNNGVDWSLVTSEQQRRLKVNMKKPNFNADDDPEWMRKFIIRNNPRLKAYLKRTNQELLNKLGITD